MFIGGPGEGHVNPTLPLVKELIHRGEEVVYFCSEEYREKITETGAEFRAYADFLHGKRPEDIKHFLEFILLLLDSSQQVIPDILQQVQDERYDYVIHDSLFGWGRLISHVLRGAVCHFEHVICLYRETAEDVRSNGDAKGKRSFVRWQIHSQHLS